MPRADDRLLQVVSFLTGFSAQSLQLTFSVFTALTLCLGLVSHDHLILDLNLMLAF
jgi:hypothetical protein